MLRRMTEKDLISKLNNAKRISPDKSWLTSNRELFLNQISNSGASDLAPAQSFYINLRSLAKTLSQPVLASMVFLFVLLGSSVFGHRLFSQAKPNDSLYIARVISEKVKLNTVLNTKSRDELAVKFAASHCKEISEVLANPDFNTEDNQAEVNRLSDSFVKEIETVKTKMTSLASLKSAKEKTALVSNTDNSNNSSSVVSDKNEASLDEADIIIASEGDYKSDKGLQLYVNEGNKIGTSEDNNSVTEIASTTNTSSKLLLSSSSEEIAGALLEEVLNESEVNVLLLEDVESLFKAGKFDELIPKLELFLKNK